VAGEGLGDLGGPRPGQAIHAREGDGRGWPSTGGSGCTIEYGRRALFERLLDLRSDIGLLAEEHDPAAGRQLGNFPQAFTHLALVSAALALGEGRSTLAP
jgi:hypothetical protein